MTRKKKILAVLITAAVILPLLFLHYKERRSYKCAICHSTKHGFQWRLGSWLSQSIPLSSKWEHVQESYLHRELLWKEHEHEWRFFQGSPYYLFGTAWGGCALGSGRHMNRFCMCYENDAEFRKFIRRQIETGQLSRKTVLQIVQLPPDDDNDNTPETSRVATLAERLLNESGR